MAKRGARLVSVDSLPQSESFRKLNPGLASRKPQQQQEVFEFARESPEKKIYEFAVPVLPMGKPRMTRRDTWKKRPCVLRYRAYKDALRKACPKFSRGSVWRVDWIAYIEMAESWSKKKKQEHKGQLHRQRPDKDNIDKGILDAIFKEDSVVSAGYHEKRWDDGNGPRLIIKLYFL